MKLIIAGGRNIRATSSQIEALIRSLNISEISEVVSGGAKGIDSYGEDFAKSNNIPIKQFLPNWDLGLKAGPLRNRDMALYGDALLLIWDGKSKGSASMKREMQKLGKPIYEFLQ